MQPTVHIWAWVHRGVSTREIFGIGSTGVLLQKGVHLESVTYSPPSSHCSHKSHTHTPMLILGQTGATKAVFGGVFFGQQLEGGKVVCQVEILPSAEMLHVIQVTKL